LVGAALVAAGAALILLDASDVEAWVIVVVIGGAAVLTYLVTSYRLREHVTDTMHHAPSWWWCLRHPRWRP
jgi:hypothetical protein